LKEAEKLLDEVLNVRRKHLGEKHRDVAMTLLASATLYLVRDEKKALALATEALTIFQRAELNEPLVSMLGDYFQAKIARAVFLFDDADKRYQGLLTGTKAYIGEEDPLYALLLADYAGLLVEMKKLPQAGKTLREALAIGEKSSLRNHPVMVDGILDLAGIEFKLDRFSEAEKLYRKAIERMKPRETLTPDAAARLTEVVERLVQLYKVTGNAAEADRWRKEFVDRKAAMKKKSEQ
jgi:tetratricopeptide (TPR) repeat protein